ncbi:MAG: hypothetical protein JJU10_05575 [Idiomarina sp.]|nr:hypothetical protein [Idiomarina sp.]
MDVVDVAQQEESHALSVALSKRKPTGPLPRGYCLECGDEDVGNSRWCSAKCAADWERREKQAGRL